MSEIIGEVTKWAIDLVTRLGYLGVFLGMLLNSAGIPIPSEVVAGFSGYLVSQGQLNIFLVALIGAVGNVIGGTIQYTLGMKGGRPVIQKYGKYVHFTEEKFQKVQKWFNKWGDEMVLVGQFIPIFRSYVSLPSGILKIPLKKFIPYTFIGSFTLVFLIAFISSSLGDRWEEIGGFFKRFQIFIIAAVIIGVIYLVYRYIKSLKK